MTALLADIPNPSGIVTDALVDVGGWGFDKVTEGIANWVLGAVEFFVNGAIDFLRTSSTPDVGAAWFSGPDSPYAAVRNVAAFLLVGFAFLGIIQGLINGDAAGMIRRIVGNLPAAVIGMVITTAIVGQLLDLTDAMAEAVLVNTGGQALHFLSGFGATVTSATNGFAAVLLGVVAVVAGLLLWIELIVRASLVYILVAVSPLGFAATLWPSARGILRKTVELLLAVIVSKLVISIALVIGVAALSGAGTAGTNGPAGAGFESSAGGSLGGLLVGAVLLGLAAFSPFIVLKLVPVAEAAMVAQGVSRGPWRATQAGMSTAYSASTLSRIAGGRSGGGLPAAPGGTGIGTAGGSTPGSVAGGTAAAAGPLGVATAGGSAVVAGAAQSARKVADTASGTGGNAAGPGSTAAAARLSGGDR